MALFGWLLFIIGAAMLLFFGIIGVDTGFDGNRVGNLPGMLTGVAMMISGSVFAAVGTFIEIILLQAKQQKLPNRTSEKD